MSQTVYYPPFYFHAQRMRRELAEQARADQAQADAEALDRWETDGGA